MESFFPSNFRTSTWSSSKSFLLKAGLVFIYLFCKYISIELPGTSTSELNLSMICSTAMGLRTLADSSLAEILCVLKIAIKIISSSMQWLVL
jgi:hypothetical protein